MWHLSYPASRRADLGVWTLSRAALVLKPITAASILDLIRAIEHHTPTAPAAIAFRSALRRKGIEVDAAGGLRALDVLMAKVTEADFNCADGGAGERLDGLALGLVAQAARFLPRGAYPAIRGELPRPHALTPAASFVEGDVTAGMYVEPRLWL